MTGLLQLMKDTVFQETLAAHLPSSASSPDPDRKNWFNKAIRSVETQPNYVVPVLGVQGAGKSSFLNALLFSDVVLPVDADETTCIPTEVRWADIETPLAEVLFADGTSISVDCSESGLVEFVHQNNNPGNQKNVRLVRIRIRHPILAAGLVLVDLPGVGSLTEANRQTTLDYLKVATGCVFLIRTVPPVTKSEATFIQGAMPQMANCFFVQNQWTDETPDEIKEGLDRNKFVLGKIAKECHRGEAPIFVDVVCVKRALDGMVLDDRQMVELSGLPGFASRLEGFSTIWRREMVQGYIGQLLHMTQSAGSLVREKLSNADLSRADFDHKLSDQKAQFRNELREKEDSVASCRVLMRKRQNELDQLVKDKAKVAAENLRNAVRKVIDQGIVGGDQLTHAYSDYEKEQSEEVFQTVQTNFMEVSNEIVARIDGIGDFTFVQQETSSGGPFAEKTKVHEHYGKVGGLAGGVAGGFAGAWAGAAVGTAVGGPLGTVVGFVTGALVSVLGGLLGSATGNGARYLHLETQKEDARQTLFSRVNQFESRLGAIYGSILEELVRSIGKTLTEWINSREGEFRAQVHDLEVAYSRSQENLDREVQLLRVADSRLTAAEKTLGEAMNDVNT